MLSRGIMPSLPISTLANCTRGKAVLKGLPWWLSGKESACQCRRCKRCGFSPWVGKIPWRRQWQPTPVFLPRKFHGQRSLAGCSPWGNKKLDTTEHVCINTHTQSWKILKLNKCKGIIYNDFLINLFNKFLAVGKPASSWLSSATSQSVDLLWPQGPPL